jgi:hypothetical protein
MGLPCQIRTARGTNVWASVRTSLAIYFRFFNFDPEFLNGVSNSTALRAQIYKIPIALETFGGRQAKGGSDADFVRLSNEKSPKMPRYPSSKARKSAQPISLQNQP